jgi:anti-anti-sigma regulatory factor
VSGRGSDAEREGEMNEHEKDPTRRVEAEALPVLETEGVGNPVKKSDLVVDLSGIQGLDVANLSLLLTTQQKAEKEDRDVWLVGVPMEVWQALHAMGLGRFFKAFPVSGEVTV